MVSNKSATITDKLIGQRVRAHRLSRGLTQEEFGAMLGVTFAQIQQYEYGTNRISSSRLFKIAEILEVPVVAFFQTEKASSKGHPSPFDLLDDSTTLQMLQEFSKIPNYETRRSVLALVEQLVTAANANGFSIRCQIEQEANKTCQTERLKGINLRLGEQVANSNDEKIQEDRLVAEDGFEPPTRGL